MKRVGTWWIKDGLDARRIEAQGFGEVLELLSAFDWTQDHGNENVLKKDFVETSNYSEKVDKVDIMFMCSHGVYDPDDSSTWGHAFATSGGSVTTPRPGCVTVISDGCPTSNGSRKTFLMRIIAPCGTRPRW